MYDRNGLELTPVQTSLNAYKFTAVNPKARVYSAYAQSTRNRGVYSMVTIAKFTDPRDAAFVGQEFAKIYDEDTILQMAIDGTFKEIAVEFVHSLTIPQWTYPAEGLDWDDIHGSKTGLINRVENARQALVEAIKVADKPIPPLSACKALIARVESMYASGDYSYRSAAKTVAQEI